MGSDVTVIHSTTFRWDLSEFGGRIYLSGRGSYVYLAHFQSEFINFLKLHFIGIEIVETYS